MRSLILLRHGKAERSSAGGDASRGLTGRGRKEARGAGRVLAACGAIPDAAISSPARRAADTLQLVMDGGGWACPTRNDPALGGDVEDLLTLLAAEPDEAALLLVVGHEPTWSAATSALIGGGRVAMPTAGMARVDLDIANWSAVRPASGELAWLVRPRLWRDAGHTDEA